VGLVFLRGKFLQRGCRSGWRDLWTYGNKSIGCWGSVFDGGGCAAGVCADGASPSSRLSGDAEAPGAER
jgi:hypothetical protein